MVETFLIDNMGWIALIIFVSQVIWFFVSLKLNLSSFTVVVPMVIMLVLFGGIGTYELGLIDEDQKSFCLDQGYIGFKGKYCVDEEDGYLIEQEVRRVNGEWLFVQNNSRMDEK